MRTASAHVTPEAHAQQPPRSRAEERRRRREAKAAVPAPARTASKPFELFYSLRLGLVLLTILTIASIIGTAIDPLERAQSLIYYTWWYKLLLLALAVNMGFATVRTVQRKVIPSRRLRLQTSEDFFETAKPAAACEFKGTIEQVAAEFRRQGCEVKVEGDFGIARKGWISRIGAPVSHVGLIVILSTGFMASWLAKEAVVRIPEGATIDTMMLRDGKQTEAPLGFNLTLDDFSTGYFPRTRIPSHYSSVITATSPEGKLLYHGPVEVNSSPEINGWRLHQTSYEELPNQVRRNVSITAPGAKEAVTVEVSPGAEVAVPGQPGTTFLLDPGAGWTIAQGAEVVAVGNLMGNHGSALTLTAKQFEPDFVLGQDKKPTSRSQELNNPALLVEINSDGAPAARQWLFGRDDMKQFSHSNNEKFSLELVETKPQGDGRVYTVDVKDTANLLLGRVTLALGEVKPVGDQPAADEPAQDLTAGWTITPGETVTAHATVLSMSRNPILPAIYAACLLMMSGLVLGFFVRRREVWFHVDRAAGRLRVVAHYRQPAEELDRATAGLLARLQTPAPHA